MFIYTIAGMARNTEQGGEQVEAFAGEARTRLRRLNINLLYALDAVLNLPSLTAAAQSAAISQPAMSVKLRQLRDHFGDELILFGERRQLTALGQALQCRIGALLREVDDTFNLTLDFDPATATATVTLAAPEVIELMFLSRIVPALRKVAPGIRIHLVPFVHGSVRRMFDTGVDVAIVPERMVDDGLRAAKLLTHGPAGLVRNGHPLADRVVSEAEYLAARHAAVYEDMEKAVFGDYGPNDMLGRRDVVVRTGLHSMLPVLAIESDLIVTTSSWFAQHQAVYLPVTLIDFPALRRNVGLVAQWQPYRDQEPVIQWLVAELQLGADAISHPETAIIRA